SPSEGGRSSIVHSSASEPNWQLASTQRPSRVREMLPVAGRFREASRLPQYLISATLTFARAVVSAPSIVERCGSSPFISLPHPLTARSRPLGQRGPPLTDGTCAVNSIGAERGEKARLALIEALRMQRIAQAKVGVVEVMTELVEERAEERARGDHL